MKENFIIKTISYIQRRLRTEFPAIDADDMADGICNAILKFEINKNNFEIHRVKCWALHNNTHDAVMELIDCGMSGECIYKYIICYDQNQGENISSLISSEIIGGEFCSSTFPLPDEENYPGDEEWTTYCFYMYGCQ